MTEPDYKGFACKLMNVSTDNTGACDWIDGDDLQSLAEQYGLLRKEQRVVPCQDGCNCLDFADEGETVDCYRHAWDKNIPEVKSE